MEVEIIFKNWIWGLKDSETLTSRVFAEEQEWGGGRELRNKMNIQW